MYKIQRAGHKKENRFFIRGTSWEEVFGSTLIRKKPFK